MPLRQPAPRTFELGLVMAGAVSAGAYTAGVLDFLFEALREWEKTKLAALATGTQIPDHKVVTAPARVRPREAFAAPSLPWFRCRATRL